MNTESAVITCVIAFVVGLVAALLATPAARRVAIRYGILDQPSERKAHLEPVPYLGGLGIVFAFVLVVLVGALTREVEASSSKLAMVFGGAAVLAVMGLRDDLRVVPGWVKAVVEVPLAIGVYASGIRAELFTNDVADLALTVAWVAGITNAVNFLDNMDGITAGVSAVAAATMAGLAAWSGLAFLAGIAAALAGCALGFLRYNRPPARIFMGDVGSLFLGFLLAVIGLELDLNELDQASFLVPVVVLGVPIFDTLMISATRISRGHSPLRPGLDHTSHRLQRLGLSRGQVIGVHYTAALALAGIGVGVALAGEAAAYSIGAAVVGLGALLAVVLVWRSAPS